MDPNWFYSTLAQSTAAVVGLAGGFLFTWLLSRRGEVIVERRTYIDWLNRIIGQLEDLKRRTDTVRLQTEDVLRKIRDQQAAGVSHDRLAIPQFELLSHSAYTVPHPSVEDLTALEQLLPLYEQLQGATANDRGDLARALLSARPLEPRGAPAYREVEIRHNPFDKTGIGPENFWSGIRMQKDHAIWRWQEIAREYDRLAFALKNFRERLVPGSIYFLILILFGLVAAGVVAPMAFLSAHAGPSKWLLFAISAPLVVAFVGYLAYEVRRLRHAADLSRDTI
jgi:hypothetical protein